MWFFVSLIPATIWVVIGYFILFSSTKSEGAVQKFGQIPAAWVFIIAALLPLMGAYATLSGFSLEAMMKPMHERMHPPEGSEGTPPYFGKVVFFFKTYQSEAPMPATASVQGLA